MPLVDTLFARFGDVVLLPGRELTAQHVADADILLVRSVTRVDQALLDGSKVRFVGSATIGTDHVDLPYLHDRRITFASAPGCNADAVVNYVLAALCRVAPDWRNQTVGIVGCGNVGSLLYKALTLLGVTCRCYDPFLSSDQHPDLDDFDAVMQSTILCLHTPLTRAGPYPTYHMFNAAVMAALQPGTLLLNAGRGGVVDNLVLKEHIRSGRLRAVLDVWEHEPDIDRELLQLVELGTPHIAGYSLEGRLRGTTMIYEAVCRWLGDVAEDLDIAALADRVVGSSSGRGERLINPGVGEDFPRQVLSHYDPSVDFSRLRQAVADAGTPGKVFDQLRKDYPLRREFLLSFPE